MIADSKECGVTIGSETLKRSSKKLADMVFLLEITVATLTEL